MAYGSAAAIENDETVGGDGGTTQTDNDDFNTIDDYSDLDWADMTWNFTCSTTETSTWAQAGRKFGELMEQATGGKVKVDVYAADQLTGGNQSEGIQALMNGDPVQISMHSNLIYSAFDPRFNVVSLPYLFDSVEDADAKLDGERTFPANDARRVRQRLARERAEQFIVEHSTFTPPPEEPVVQQIG